MLSMNIKYFICYVDVTLDLYALTWLVFGKLGFELTITLPDL